MPYGVIYLLTNSVNGKYYVGQTRNMRSRIAAYKRHEAVEGHQRPMALAIKKYGWDAFTMDILATADNADALTALECAWILMLMAHVPRIGYNRRFGAGDSGFTEAGRKAMSEAQKKNPVRYWLGKKRPEMVEWFKQRKACKPVVQKPPRKSRKGIALGQFWTDNANSKRSEALKAYYATDAGKAHALKATVSRWQKQKAAGVKTQNSPEARLRRSAAAKEQYKDPALREKLRQAANKRWGNS